MAEKVASRRLRVVRAQATTPPRDQDAVREAYWAQVRSLRDERARLRAG
ncbi:hypothetical protein [Knoellia subterranea]|nr:hypothetical protein [Knoellia subterranea]